MILIYLILYFSCERDLKIHSSIFEKINNTKLSKNHKMIIGAAVAVLVAIVFLIFYYYVFFDRSKSSSSSIGVKHKAETVLQPVELSSRSPRGSDSPRNSGRPDGPENVTFTEDSAVERTSNMFMQSANYLSASFTNKTISSQSFTDSSSGSPGVSDSKSPISSSASSQSGSEEKDEPVYFSQGSSHTGFVDANKVENQKAKYSLLFNLLNKFINECAETDVDEKAKMIAILNNIISSMNDAIYMDFLFCFRIIERDWFIFKNRVIYNGLIDLKGKEIILHKIEFVYFIYSKYIKSYEELEKTLVAIKDSGNHIKLEKSVQEACKAEFEKHIKNFDVSKKPDLGFKGDKIGITRKFTNNIEHLHNYPLSCIESRAIFELTIDQNIKLENTQTYYAYTNIDVKSVLKKTLIRLGSSEKEIENIFKKRNKLQYVTYPGL